MLRYLWEDAIGKCILIGVPILLGLMAWATIADSKQWSEFRISHNCKIVGRMSGSVSPTVAPIIGGNGGIAVGMSVALDKTGWACNDGVTYWR